MIPVKIYDSPTASEPKADLGDAFEISYTQKTNEVWTAEFSLPADDPHLDLIDVMDLAEVFDNGKRVELFQITNKIPTRDEDGHPKVTFKLKHVLNYLNRDLCGENLVLDPDTGNYRPLQKTGISTALSFIIGEQSVSRWQLGNVDFSASYTYEFNKIKLLDAIRKVPNALWENWQFSFDTTSYPWTLNIVAPNPEPQALIYYGKNMESIRQEVDPEDLVTKVYAYGTGSGEDEITAGPFTDDPHGYGIIEDVFNDHRFEDSASLGSAAQNWLDKHNSPKVTYTGKASDYQVRYGTNDFQVGDYVTVYDAMLGIGADVRVIELAKENVGNNPVLDYTLSNKFQEDTNFGALAFKDKVDQTDIAPRSISGEYSGGLGKVGSLKSDSVNITALNDDGSWGTRISVNETGISTNVSDIDGNSTSITQNATDIGLRVKKDDVINQINISTEGVTIDSSQLGISSDSSIDINSAGKFSLNAGSVNITALNDDGGWGSRITANENGIATNVTDIDGNSSSITANSDNISLLVSDINGNSSEILATDNQISLNVQDISGNASSIQANSDEIALKVNASVDDVMSYINLSGQGIELGTDGEGTSQIQLKPSGHLKINASNELDLDAPNINITSLNDDGSWGSRITTNESGISTNVTDINSNSTSISQNATDISTNVSDISGNQSSISQNATDISTNVSDISGNSSSISQNATDISAKVDATKSGVMSYVNLSSEGLKMGTDGDDIAQIQLKPSGRMQFNASNEIDIDAPKINITSLNDDGGWGSTISANSSQISTNVSDIAGNSSSISQNATDITAKVSKNDVINQINISTEGTTINASELGISSDSSISIDANGKFSLNASNITIGSFDPTGAKSAINSDTEDVSINAENINITGTTTLDSWQYESTTTIDGGKIEADTLSVTNLKIDGNLDMTDPESGIGQYVTGVDMIKGAGDASTWIAFDYLNHMFINDEESNYIRFGNPGIDLRKGDMINIGWMEASLESHLADPQAHQDVKAGSGIEITYEMGTNNPIISLA